MIISASSSFFCLFFNVFKCCYPSSMWKTADEVISWYCMHCRSRSSHQKVFYKKMCSPKFHKIHRKTLVQSFFFNKGQRPATVLKKRLWRKCFPVNFAKFLKTPFLQNTSEWLLVQKASNILIIPILRLLGVQGYISDCDRYRF